MDNHSQDTREQSGRIQRWSLAIASLTALTVIAADQFTKWRIWNTVGPAGDRFMIEVMPWVDFHFVRNTGSAFGMFQGQSSILTVLAFLALAMLGVFFFQNARQDPLVALALGLLAGGAIGNLVDRIRFGYVIDFIKVPNFPTFNVADSAITVGVVILIYTLVLRDMFRGPVADRDPNSGERVAAEATGED